MKLYKMTFTTKEYIKTMWHSTPIELTTNEKEALDFDPWDTIIEYLEEQGFTRDLQKGRQKDMVL